MEKRVCLVEFSWRYGGPFNRIAQHEHADKRELLVLRE